MSRTRSSSICSPKLIVTMDCSSVKRSSSVGMDVYHPERNRMDCAGSGGFERRRGLQRPVPRPEPMRAAPPLGLAGTAKRAGAFL